MVAIKDMEMPRSCKECKDKRIDHITFELCLRTGRNVVDCKDYRHCDCPLVEIEERKVGEWENTNDPEEWFGDQFKCSVCGAITLGNGLYCPHCGAEMENGEKND